MQVASCPGDGHVGPSRRPTPVLGVLDEPRRPTTSAGLTEKCHEASSEGKREKQRPRLSRGSGQGRRTRWVCVEGAA